MRIRRYYLYPSLHVSYVPGWSQIMSGGHTEDSVKVNLHCQLSSGLTKAGRTIVCIRCAIVKMVDSLNSSRIVLETRGQLRSFGWYNTHSAHRYHLVTSADRRFRGCLSSQSIEAVASSMTKTLFLLKIARAMLPMSASSSSGGVSLPD